MMKIFVPQVSLKYHHSVNHLVINGNAGEIINIIMNGIELHPGLELCDKEEESDYIFMDFRHVGKYQIRFPEKTILLDYKDGQSLFDVNTLLYFKRSIVNKKPLSFRQYDKTVIPISYCIRNECLSFDDNDLFKSQRELDVAMFFKPQEDGADYRSRIAYQLKNKYPSAFVGLAGESGGVGRNSIQEQYFSTMRNSKIVVTCNPDNWEGDYRLFEAMTSGSMILVDKMITPVTNPFIDGQHLVYYDRDNYADLLKKVAYYLEHDEERRLIAQQGYEHARKFHTSKSRMDEILHRISETPFEYHP